MNKLGGLRVQRLAATGPLRVLVQPAGRVTVCLVSQSLPKFRNHSLVCTTDSELDKHMAALPAEILDEAVDDLHVARVDLGPRGVGQRCRLGEAIAKLVDILVVVIPRVVVGGGRGGRGPLVHLVPVGLCHGGNRRESHAPDRDFKCLL